jgi:hypothetical protein
MQTFDHEVTTMRRLSEAGLPKLVELLRERLACQQACIRMYDALLAHLATEEPAIARIAVRVQLHRDEEEAQTVWLGQELRKLGADLSQASARAELVQRELKGLEEVALESGAIASQKVHALLVAELANEASWALLAELAIAAGDEPARLEFEERRLCENRHASYLCRVIDAFTRNEVLGYPVTLPLD